jgi:transposase
MPAVPCRSPETEVAQDEWDLTVFGHSGTVSFTGISQFWLRESAKRWAADNLPKRRVRPGRRTSAGLDVRHYVGCLVRLSESLRMRADRGEHPAVLGRADMEAFLHRVEALSIRELAERHRVHRRTVRQALAAAVPPPRKAYARRSRPAIDPYVEVIDSWLLGDREVPHKQRHTARRVWQRLVGEHGAQMAEVTVTRYVARRKRALELDRVEVALPQTHAPCAEAEVDFGELYATIAGVLIKLWMFVMRMSHSGKAFHVAFATQAQEALLEGHVLAFEHFGAVPARVRYDNLKPAMVRVLRGRDRIESERFIALRSHYGFDGFFCLPGKQDAHEKGGVEGEIGRFRRWHLVPVPNVASLTGAQRVDRCQRSGR